jgi:hypothetical protein
MACRSPAMKMRCWSQQACSIISSSLDDLGMIDAEGATPLQQAGRTLIRLIISLVKTKVMVFDIYTPPGFSPGLAKRIVIL